MLQKYCSLTGNLQISDLLSLGEERRLTSQESGYKDAVAAEKIREINGAG